MPLETDVEEFVRRVDTIVSDTQIETRPGTGIIEETVDFPPGEFVIERGRLGIQTRNTKTTSLPCSVPNIVCDSREASKTKCGYSEYFGFVSIPPKIYLQKDETLSDIDEDSCGVPPTNPTTHTCGYGSVTTASRTAVYDPITCIETDPSAGGTFSRIFNAGCGDFPPPANIFGAYGFHGFLTPESAIQAAGRTHHITPGNSSCAESREDAVTLQIISNEYDTETLKQNVRAALPPYSERYECFAEPPFLLGQNCLCSAQSFLATNETFYFFRRFQYKFVFPNGEFAQKCQVLEWDDAFTPDNGGPVEGTHHSFVCEGGETEIGPFECFERDTNGTATITNFETFCQLPCPDMSCPPCA